MFFMAFSLEHEPHIMVVMLDNPFGATLIRTDCNRFGQSAPGNTPRAGRFTKAAKSNTNQFVKIDHSKRFWRLTSTYSSSYVHCWRLSAIQDGCSPVEPMRFVYKCQAIHYHQRRPSSYPVIYHNQRTIAPIRHSKWDHQISMLAQIEQII